MISLYYGEEQFLSLRAAKLALSQLEGEKPELIDGESLTASEIVAKFSNFGMFSAQPPFFIKRLFNNSDAKEIAEALSKAANDIECIVWDSQKIPSNSLYLKSFKTTGKVFDFTKLNKRSFWKWGDDEAKEILGEGRLNSNTIEQLADLTNYDTERFYNELLKMKLSGDTDLGQTVSTMEGNIWELMTLINQNSREAIKKFNDLIEQGEDPYAILGMIARNFRLITQLDSLKKEGADRGKIIKVLRIPPFTLPQLEAAARHYPLDKLVKIYEKIYKVEHEMKTSNIEPSLGITLLISFL